MAFADPQAAPTLVGSSAATRTLDDDVTAASRSDAKVLITGESGVGKDVAARLIHGRSSQRPADARHHQLRRPARFAARNRAVRPREGQLHRRASRPSGPARRSPTAAPSSSTKSARCRCGCRRCCSASSRRARSSRSAPTAREPQVDVRVISATHRDLRQRRRARDVPRGPVLPAERRPHPRPPLRERREDIPVSSSTSWRTFAEHHGVGAAGPTPDALALLSLRLAGQRPRAAQRARAHGAAARRRGDADDLPRELRLGPAVPADVARWRDRRDTGRAAPAA